MKQTEKAHQDLRSVLLAGRILVNGLPLTANELSTIIQGEQMLFEKAMQLDSERAAAKKAEKEPKKKKE